MSLETIAKEWLAARKIIADAATEAQIPIEPNRFAEAVIARLAFNKPPILLEMIKDGATVQDYAELIDLIDRTLRVAAAEYVPAIGDVFTLIDRFKATHPAPATPSAPAAPALPESA